MSKDEWSLPLTSPPFPSSSSSSETDGKDDNEASPLTCNRRRSLSFGDEPEALNAEEERALKRECWPFGQNNGSLSEEETVRTKQKRPRDTNPTQPPPEEKARIGKKQRVEPHQSAHTTEYNGRDANTPYMHTSIEQRSNARAEPAADLTSEDYSFLLPDSEEEQEGKGLFVDEEEDEGPLLRTEDMEEEVVLRYGDDPDDEENMFNEEDEEGLGEWADLYEKVSS